MMSERLRERPIFSWREDTDSLTSEEQALIDRAVRRLVLLMKAYETHGVASREVIEEAVIHSLEKAEFRYYALSEHEIMHVIEWESRNEKGRRQHR